MLFGLGINAETIVDTNISDMCTIKLILFENHIQLNTIYLAATLFDIKQ
jgi:hypothetical protein